MSTNIEKENGSKEDLDEKPEEEKDLLNKK